jgi:hypothetical protein
MVPSHNFAQPNLPDFGYSQRYVHKGRPPLGWPFNVF